MPLESRYRQLFGGSDRGKGERLVSSVCVFQGGSSKLVCEVSEIDQIFEVTLNCEGKQSFFFCDCNSLKNKTCHHIWAVLLHADKFSLFQDGCKRGVRLAGTAAAEKSAEEKIIKSATVSTLKPISSFGEVTKELLLVINGPESRHTHSISVDCYWRPAGEKGPLRQLIPSGDLSGFSGDDYEILKHLSLFNTQNSGSFHLSDKSGVFEPLRRAVFRNILFTRKLPNQKQFKKVRKATSAKVELEVEINSESQYLLSLNVNNHLLSDMIFCGSFLFISETEIYKSANDAAKLKKYIDERGDRLNSWEVEDFVNDVLRCTDLDLSSLPGRLQCNRVKGEVKGHLYVRTAVYKFREKEQLHADLFYCYGPHRISENSTESEVLDFYNSKILQRDNKEEKQLREKLIDLGLRYNKNSHKEEKGWKLSPPKLPEIVKNLLREGWTVVAEGKTYTAPRSFSLTLSAGTDWFDLKGEAEYDNEVVPVAGLVKASKEGNQYVQLGDGSFGILPEDWLKHYTVLTQLGEVAGDNLRFRKSQALIIEKLFEERLHKDEGFKALKKSLNDSAKIKKASCHPDFQGLLRPYQEQGLAWLEFLQRSGFGGILADDMGLGKTVQVLALILNRKKFTEKPVLLVVPRSLIFNWQSEIMKFTPSLTFLIYSGKGRQSMIDSFDTANIVITTYGTLRQDIELLVNYDFDYCILDESQAIKNRDSATSRAVRLINASHRISMSGTPVENSLSDLVSQFEFLNPGMTGQGKLASLVQGDEKLNRKTLKILKEAFKPFILRRTKGEVAKDLPEKTEQIVYCEMDSQQKKIYDQTLAWYRRELTKDDKPEAGNKKGVQFLGALTRLRQLACHPQLVNEEFDCDESVKLKVLHEKLKEIISEGHRVLIFSQFTSFLSLIKKQIKNELWKYCYLDGSTVDRQGEVDSFQNNSDIPLFLISLKAGGVGLNLTGADYVFIMDPWWNPAIENQAIDRAYRIGQKKNVIACRLICRGTVEEKVLRMQQQKKKLSESLIGSDDLIVDKISIKEMIELLS